MGETFIAYRVVIVKINVAVFCFLFNPTAYESGRAVESDDASVRILREEKLARVERV